MNQFHPGKIHKTKAKIMKKQICITSYYLSNPPVTNEVFPF